MAEFKNAIRRSHPYEGVSPEEDLVEKLPIMSGHDDQIEVASGQGYPHTYSTPFEVEQTLPPSGSEPHEHPGDAIPHNPYH